MGNCVSDPYREYFNENIPYEILHSSIINKLDNIKSFTIRDFLTMLIHIIDIYSISNSLKINHIKDICRLSRDKILNLQYSEMVYFECQYLVDMIRYMYMPEKTDLLEEIRLLFTVILTRLQIFKSTASKLPEYNRNRFQYYYYFDSKIMDLLETDSRSQPLDPNAPVFEDNIINTQLPSMS